LFESWRTIASSTGRSSDAAVDIAAVTAREVSEASTASSSLLDRCAPRLSFGPSGAGKSTTHERWDQATERPRVSNKTVRNVMMPEPWTVDAHVSLQEAAHAMRAWDLRSVLVTDDGELRGVLTDHDIIVLAIASGRNPSTLLAGECADPCPYTVAADDPADHAIDYMQRHGLRRLPVVDGQRLVGTVWITDLVIASHGHPGVRATT
jgi:CBS domain-containing protein